MLNQLVTFILETANALGYLGVFLLMTIESSFIPFPSEAILIPAGAVVAQGNMSFLGVLAVSILGSILGATINYTLALYLGRSTINLLIKKYGKILFLNTEKLAYSDRFFTKHGKITTLVGRLIPIVRQLISLPAGFSKMPLAGFIIFTALGSGIWSIILISLGYFIGDNLEMIRQNITLITAIVVMMCLVTILIYVYLTLKRKSKTKF
ncbi:DedA family protein [Candidatus Pacearchaeota archaeon CG10_big_fil_rev_8_21_14_0_10_34_76]|nr:MAG: DedA family protein [Candidatus Pacearchaeota archaeon CG10_big_fil_rev_8_21_14_0_10_34_76]